MKLNYENLNENQKIAVNHFEGPCMVLAGPGSGKTRVISYRIINLIENLNINPDNILAISFTKASSIEMRDRSISLSSTQRINKVNFGTFHSIFFRILRSFRNYKLENILDEKEKRYIIRNILKSMDIENAEEEEIINGVINEISLLKNELININEFTSNIISKEEFFKLYNMYENYKEDMKKVDFDDMLIHTYNLLKENENILNIIRRKYKYILIDEFQDINKVQFEVLKLIAKPLENIFVVGDEDQSIYGFRGARPDFLLEFEKYFSNVKNILLDVNYRSTDNIIKKSNKLISKNEKRYEKHIKGVKVKGDNIVFINPDDSEEEAKKIGSLILESINKFNLKYSDFAIIYRTNIQSRALIDVFMDMNIPFMVRDTVVSIYDHWIAKDINSYLKVSIDNTLKEEFSRIINKPFRYISKESIKIAMADGDFLNNIKTKCNLKPWQIKTIEDLEYDLSYIRNLSAKDAISYIRTSLEYDRYLIDYCEKRKIKITGLFEILNEIEGSASNFKNIYDYLNHIEKVKEEILNQRKEYYKDRVVLTTIHSSKGLEFKNVFIAGAIEGVIPHDKSIEENNDIEEERRLFYVAMTRAMDKLYILSPKNKYGKRAYVSRFVEEINEPTKEELDLINEGDIIYHKKYV
ncbi:ATP-dependent helicase [Tepidibacter formicigenes]|jgi:DNA helicase-2/ATP-dependent DNA helicase PcrA|uniref:DNA 3'-5' helicase n=1 Tax=Tepidibacter formicigenes DSM 15518 TaxID=1123349 RepID=A0A1M6NNB6_9FIRM|nr:ATP-dependent helicase [Tepidibacter formicigenes]SHJ97134.1 DNA helicase-2 / ATP-dependent DNA helicase PcrA [Tepidibacter formicigenes DSM 15518]